MTYQLTHLYTLVLPVATTKGTHIVEFKGVQNMNMHGLFTTTDAQFQAALEATPEYQRHVFRRLGSTNSKSVPAESDTSVVQKPDVPKSDQIVVSESSKSVAAKCVRKSSTQ